MAPSYITVANAIKDLEVRKQDFYNYLNDFQGQFPLFNNGIVALAGEKADSNLQYALESDPQLARFKVRSHKWTVDVEENIGDASDTEASTSTVKFLEGFYKTWISNRFLEYANILRTLGVIKNIETDLLNFLFQNHTYYIEWLVCAWIKGISIQAAFDSEIQKLIKGSLTATFSSLEANVRAALASREDHYSSSPAYMVANQTTIDYLVEQDLASSASIKLFNWIPVNSNFNYNYSIENNNTIRTLNNNGSNLARALFYKNNMRVIIHKKMSDGLLFICSPGSFRYARTNHPNPIGVEPSPLKGHGEGKNKMGMRHNFSLSPFGTSFAGTQSATPGAGKYARDFGVTTVELAKGSFSKAAEYSKDCGWSIVLTKFAT